MKPPRLYKPARRIQRILSIIGILSIVVIIAAPFFGILGRSLIISAIVCLGVLAGTVIAKLAVHVYSFLRRYGIKADVSNVESIRAFQAASKDANDLVNKILKPSEEMTWGHCIAIRKQCYREAIRARFDRFLEGLERLKII